MILGVESHAIPVDPYCNRRLLSENLLDNLKTWRGQVVQLFVKYVVGKQQCKSHSTC